jgi:tyrosine-protein kinase Etk/Wzc
MNQPASSSNLSETVVMNGGDTGDDEISLLDLLETIAENLKLLIIGPLVAGLAALGISFVMAPTFTAKTVIMPPQAQQSLTASLVASLGALSGAASAVAGLKNPNDQIVALIKSRTLADRMVDRFDLMTRYKSKLRQDARKGLESRTRIASGKDGLISIEVDDVDPKMAADMASGYVQELSRLLASLAISEAQQRRLFFERQLKEAKDNMTKAEIALRSGGIEADIFKSSPQAAVTAVAQVQAQIAAQEVKLGAMRGYLTEAAPEFKQGLTELQALRAQLAKLESNPRDRAVPNAGAAAAGTAVGASAEATGTGGGTSAGTTSQNQAASAGGALSDYVTRFRDYKYFETLFELFAKQYEIARVDESREGAVIQIVDPAAVPEWKSKPKRGLIAVIASLAAGFALLLYVFVVKALRNAAQDAESAAKIARIRAAISLRPRDKARPA